MMKSDEFLRWSFVAVFFVICTITLITYSAFDVQTTKMVIDFDIGLIIITLVSDASHLM